MINFKKIIIAPKQMHRFLLLKERKDDVFSDTKLLTKEEIISKYYGTVSEEGIIYLLKNTDLKYANLKQFVQYIPFANKDNKSEKNKFLYSLKEDLIKSNHFNKDEYFDEFIKDKIVDIYGYSMADTELSSIFDHYNIKPNFHLNKLGKKFDVKCYLGLDDEVLNVLNDIASLLDEGKKPEDIIIYTTNELALMYLEKYHNDFGFEINFPNDMNLYSQEYISNFISDCINEGSFEHAIENISRLDIENKEEVVSYLNSLINNDLDFDKKLDYIVEKLKSKKIKNNVYDNAIDVISTPCADEGKDIFIIGFTLNSFPKSFKDDEYISDKDKSELGVLTSLEKCKIENELCKSFLGLDSIFHISYSNSSVSEKYFPSPFIEELGLKKINAISLHEQVFSKRICTKKLSTDEDKKLYFNEISPYYDSLKKQFDINYRKYDNSYSNSDAVSKDDILKHSYSSVDEYFKCPFKYYLTRVLHLDPKEDTLYTKVGTLAHEIFEHQYDCDFDFDKSFEIAKSHTTWSKAENIIVDNLKSKIKEASDAAILHKNVYMNNPVIYTEKKVNIKLDDYCYLVGTIDKTVILNNEYACIVDYKTGKDSFKMSEVEDGLSLQLPTYTLLFHSIKEYEDIPIIGLFINNVLPPSLTVSKGDDDIIYPYLKLNGIVSYDPNIAKNIDASIPNGTSKFIAKLSLKSGECCFKKAKGSQPTLSEESFKQLEKLAKDKILEADNNIRNNKFDISPVFNSPSDKDGACKYCNFRDVCYLKNKQKRFLKNVEEEDSDDE